MGITSLIKYEGDNSTFVWKHPDEDFNSLTQLVVHESQEAIFMMNGQALDSFGPGRYTLDSENIPIIGKLISSMVTSEHVNERGKIVKSKESPFHCEVYFINKTVQMAIPWGTDSKVRYIDPDSGVPLELGARGKMNLAVSDGRKLLMKLVGTMNGIAWDNNEIVKDNKTGFTKSLENSFRPMISTAVKSNLSVAIKQERMDILEVDEHLEQLSAAIKKKIDPFFEDYGLRIAQFYVMEVVLPEEDKNFKTIKELHSLSLRTREIKAGATIRSAQEMAEADVIAARRQKELEQEVTKTELLRRETERKLMQAEAEAEAKKVSSFAQVEITKAQGLAEAEVQRSKGLTDAEIMRAKGYTERDVLQADVQKAYAAGLGQFGANVGNTGSSGGSTMSDMLGLGLGLKAAAAVGSQFGNLFDEMNFNGKSNETGSVAPSTIVCPKCGTNLPVNAKFCFECGERFEQVDNNQMICPVCGKKTPKGKFCMECGSPLIKTCPKCGKELPSGSKFCPECGEKID